MKLSVAIIAKNEAEIIRGCLESVKDADEIMVVDTGSEDSTLEIVHDYTYKTYWMKWGDDFSEAYNFVCSLCTGDWILSIDADEQLEEGGIVKIRDLINPYAQAYRIQLEYSEETVMGIKLLKNRAGIYWVGKAHKTLNIPVSTVLPVKIYCGSSPAHRDDPDRTLRILKRDFYDTPANTRNLYYLAREYANRHVFEDAISLFERYFEEGDDRFLRADACLYLAKIYKAQDDLAAANNCVFLAIETLPDFREAWDFAASLVPKGLDRDSCLEKAKACNNNGVRIIRKFKWSDLD